MESIRAQGEQITVAPDNRSARSDAMEEEDTWMRTAGGRRNKDKIEAKKKKKKREKRMERSEGNRT